MFKLLEEINTKIKPFSVTTAAKIWADEHTSQKMLAFHFNDTVNAASRSTDFMNSSVSWIATHFNLGESSKVIDFGCGPGLYTTRLAKFGAKVTGIDFSNYSLNYAKQLAKDENVNVEYLCEDYLQADIKGKYDLIIMIMCDYCALAPQERKKLLTKFHSILNKDGAILLDVCSLEGYKKISTQSSYEKNMLDGFWSKDPYYAFLNIDTYDKEKISLDKYTIIKKDTIDKVYYWVQYYDQSMLSKELNQSNFEIDEYYSDVAGTPWNKNSDEFAVVLRKKS